MELKLSDYGNQRETIADLAKKNSFAKSPIQVGVALARIFLQGRGQLEMTFDGQMILDYFNVGCCMVELVQSQHASTYCEELLTFDSINCIANIFAAEVWDKFS
jgi:hypothetical protein